MFAHLQKLFLIFLFLVVFSSCSTHQSQILPRVNDYYPVEAKMRDCADNFLREDIGVPPIESFRTKARVTVTHSDKNISFNSVIIFERPDKARIEFLRPGLNQIESVMTIDDNNVSAYSTSSNTVFKGQASYASIYRLFGIPLNEEELMSWFVGRLLITENSKLIEVKQSDLEKGRMYLLYDMRDGRKIRILLDGAREECMYPNFRIREIEILVRKNDTPMFHTEYTYRDDGMIPSEIKFTINEVSANGLIQIDSNNEVNVSLKKFIDRLFVINYPYNVVVKDISKMDKSDMLFNIN